MFCRMEMTENLLVLLPAKKKSTSYSVSDSLLYSTRYGTAKKIVKALKALTEKLVFASESVRIQIRSCFDPD
jgi:hypothetical protein